MLNLSLQLYDKGVLDECEIELLGTDAESIRRAEDREQFKELCEQLGEPVVPSAIAESVEEGLEAARSIGYPVILKARAGGGGKGIRVVREEKELIPACRQVAEENNATIINTHDVPNIIKYFKEIVNGL